MKIKRKEIGREGFKKKPKEVLSDGVME